MTLEDLVLLGVAGYVGYRIATRAQAQTQTVARVASALAPVPADQLPAVIEENYFIDEYGPGWSWGPSMYRGGGRGWGGGHHGGHHGGGHHGGHH